jgi:hypothetical protein
MADTALHLVERVFPEVPVRQWVCSLPWRLRVLLGYDKRLCAEVLEVFVLELSRAYKRRAKALLGLSSVDDALTGAVSVIQRGDSALRLNVRFHVIVLDGVYVRSPGSGELVFHALAAPSAEEISDVAARTAQRCAWSTRHAPASPSAWARAAGSTCTPTSPSRRATEPSSSDCAGTSAGHPSPRSGSKRRRTASCVTR